MNAKLTELAARANRPPRPPRLDQHGAVTLPRAVWDAVVNEELWVHDVGVLVGLLAQFANGGLDGHVRVRGDDLIADDQRGCSGTPTRKVGCTRRTRSSSSPTPVGSWSRRGSR